ncbi:MAG: LytTR family DNA-binding domain-containing protein [Bacillota bacterium]|nr:LytTR family DNA-binding domain-containing protein [Bacillota bacterium]
MSIRVLIVDSEERERIVLRYLLEQISEVEVIGEVGHGIEVLMMCQENKIDVVFWDLGPDEKKYMDMLFQLNKLKQAPMLVLIGSSSDQATQAWDLGVTDFVLKPIDQNRIGKTIHRVKKQIVHNQYIDDLVRERLKQRIDFMLERYQHQDIYSRKLPVREKGKISLLKPDNIIYCESEGKKVFISTSEGGYLSNYTLNELESRLDMFSFFRAHQAFIVNLNYINEIVNFGEGSYLLHLEGTKKNIILSRSRAKTLRVKLGIS